MFPGAVAWFTLNFTSTAIDEIQLLGGSQLVLMGSSSLNVKNVSGDGTGFLYVSPSSTLKITSLLDSCSKIFKGAELVLLNSLPRVDLTRSILVYGKLTLERSPSVYVGREGGTLTMFPQSSPSSLTFGDLKLEPNGKLQLLNYDVNSPENCRWVVESTKSTISLGSGSRVDIFCPLSMKGDKLISEKGSSFTIHGNGSLSNISMNVVSLDGKLDPGFLSIGNGWKELVVGTNGQFRFMPHREIKVDRIVVSGMLQVEGPLRLRGRSAAAVNTFIIEAGGSVEFDANSLLSHLVSIINNENNLFASSNLTNVSEVHAEYVTINGTWKANKLHIDPGWKELFVGSVGHFEFFSVGHYSFHKLSVNGSFRSLNAMIIKGLTKSRVSHINVGSSGVVNIESQKKTTIHSQLVTIDGTLSIGNLSVGSKWDQLNVSGHFYFKTDEPLNIGAIRVGGLVNTTSPLGPSSAIKGEFFLVEKKGKVRINYQGPPSGRHEGASNTALFVDNIVVHGTLEAGSLYASTTNLVIGATGVVSVDWGGAAGGEGFGYGIASSQGGSGASYGGRGGKGYGTRAVILPYGNIYKQGTWGSGGGHGQNGKGGGRGGGRIALFVNETADISGVIQMNGQPSQVFKRICLITVAETVLIV